MGCRRSTLRAMHGYPLLYALREPEPLFMTALRATSRSLTALIVALTLMILVVLAALSATSSERAGATWNNNRAGATWNNGATWN